MPVGDPKRGSRGTAAMASATMGTSARQQRGPRDGGRGSPSLGAGVAGMGTAIAAPLAGSPSSATVSSAADAVATAVVGLGLASGYSSGPLPRHPAPTAAPAVSGSLPPSPDLPPSIPSPLTIAADIAAAADDAPPRPKAIALQEAAVVASMAGGFVAPEAQLEEVEALSAIFGEEFSLLSASTADTPLRIQIRLRYGKREGYEPELPRISGVEMQLAMPVQYLP